MNAILTQLPALTDALCAPDATATVLAATLGAAEDPSGWGEQLTVRAPGLVGVRRAIVLCEPPLRRPTLLWLHLSESLSRDEVTAALGPGLRSRTDDGQLETQHEVRRDVCTIIARGDDTSVSELVLRRD